MPLRSAPGATTTISAGRVQRSAQDPPATTAQHDRVRSYWPCAPCAPSSWPHRRHRRCQPQRLQSTAAAASASVRAIQRTSRALLRRSSLLLPEEHCRQSTMWRSTTRRRDHETKATLSYRGCLVIAAAPQRPRVSVLSLRLPSRRGVTTASVAPGAPGVECGVSGAWPVSAIQQLIEVEPLAPRRDGSGL